jgi:hypothetical protein
MPMATRRDLFDPSDPEQLRPEQRLAEIAAILAAGVIRMRQRGAVGVHKVRLCRKWIRGTGSPRRRKAARMSQIPSDSGENRLELSRGSRPDGQCG